MKEFVDRYTKMFGEYNDKSNTKVYALEYILETLKANPAAIDNVDEFKKTMDTFSAPNPYLKGDAKLTYVGTTSFGQKRQLAVPMVVNEYRDGKFETLFVGDGRLKPRTLVLTCGGARRPHRLRLALPSAHPARD